MTDADIIAKIANSLAAIELRVTKQENNNGNGNEAKDAVHLTWKIMGALGVLTAAFGATLYFNMRGVDDWQTSRLETITETVASIKQIQAVVLSEREFMRKYNQAQIDDMRIRLERLETRWEQGRK